MAPGISRAPGERIGSFEIVRYLASGGMGDVYVALDVATGEEVALKFLADPSKASIERFEREGRIATQLTHPHIIAGRGHGRAPDGQPYIALELLKGTSLEERLRTQGITPAEVLQLTLQVCDALEVAHARRIVHRDLKPENIFLCETGTPGLHAKVLDFGIARFAGERRMTGTGVLVGSWSYMSPEQARGEPDIDERSDLWSVGVVMFECLAGRLPFDSPTGPGTLYQILFDSPPDLARLAPDLPRMFIDAVQRCLRKARDERFARSFELRSALATIDPRALPAAHVRSTEGSAATGLEATLSPSGAEMTLASDQAASLIEIRLTSVVVLRGVRDAVLVQNVARELQGSVVSLLGDGMIVVFGRDRWNGDEPERAVRLAVSAHAAAKGVGIATGRVLRGEHISGGAVDAAAGLSRNDGITLDSATAAGVTGVFDVGTRSDGSVCIDPNARRKRATIADVAFPTPMLGRDAELGMLQQCAQAAYDDQQPGGVVVLGAAGMGKSRMRHEALLRASAALTDATILGTRCEVYRQGTPFAALSDALGDVVDASVGRIFASLGKSAGDAVAALDRARTSLETVLRGLASRGAILLVIDDAQWLDPTSQSTIRWLFENAPDLPLAVWLFARPEGREISTHAVPGASLIELKPLGKSAAEQLLKHIAGSAPDALLERAGGHPLFLEELGKLFAQRGEASMAPDAELPASIESAQLAQIDQLEAADREFLKRASIFGRNAWIEGVMSLGGDAAALDRLRKGNVLLVRPRSRFENTREFAFRSGVLQEVLYGLWPGGQREKLHERAAEWLAGLGSVAPEELGRHWELGAQNARAAESYANAAEAAAPVSDDSAVGVFTEKVLALTDDARLRWRALAARDTAAQFAGDRDAQKRGLDEMQRIAPGLGVQEQAEVAWRQCVFSRVTQDVAGAQRAGEAAIALLDQGAPSKWAAAAHTELTFLHAQEGAFDEAQAHATAARRLAQDSGDEWLLARAVSAEAYAAAERYRLADAIELFQLAAAHYVRSGDRRREASSMVNAGDVMLQLGRVSQSQEVFQKALDASRRVGNQRTVVVAMHNLGVTHRLERQLDLAIEKQSTASRESARIHTPRVRLAAEIELLDCSLERGDEPASVKQRLADLDAVAGGVREPSLAAQAMAARLRAHLQLNEITKAEIEAATTLLGSLEPTLTHPIVNLGAILRELCPNDGFARQRLRTAFDGILEALEAEDRLPCARYLIARYRIREEIAAQMLSASALR